MLGYGVCDPLRVGAARKVAKFLWPDCDDRPTTMGAFRQHVAVLFSCWVLSIVWAFKGKSSNFIHMRLQQQGGKGAWEIAEPLLDARLLKEVIESWTRPLPSEYIKQPLVLVGPSAVGKNRLVKKLLVDYSKFFRKVVTHTTRLPRFDEINGTTYNFVSRETFHELRAREGFFLEESVVHNNCYGLSVEAYKEVCLDGKIAIFEVDVQGAQKLRASLAEQFDLSPHYLFIAPASLKSLEERLLVRATESPEEMTIRLNNAVGEIEASSTPGLFDKVIVNNDFEEASRSFFNTCRYWYPSLPSPSRLRMLQRRIAKVKAKAAEERADGKLK